MIITNVTVVKNGILKDNYVTLDEKGRKFPQMRELLLTALFHPLETYTAKISICKPLSKGSWEINYIAIYVKDSKSYEDITGMYSESFLNNILKCILSQLKEEFVA